MARRLPSSDGEPPLWILFALLAAFWGASYMFIKVALEDGVSPVGSSSRAPRSPRSCCCRWPRTSARCAACASGSAPMALLALVQVAAPFLLITVGRAGHPLVADRHPGGHRADLHLPAGVRARGRGARQRGVSLAGVGIGIAGVAVLLGVDAGGRRAALVGGLMVVLASLGYALGGLVPQAQPRATCSRWASWRPRWRPAR